MFTSRRQLIRATAATLAFTGFSRFAAAQDAPAGPDRYPRGVAGHRWTWHKSKGITVRAASAPVPNPLPVEQQTGF